MAEPHRVDKDGSPPMSTLNATRPAPRSTAHTEVATVEMWPRERAVARLVQLTLGLRWALFLSGVVLNAVATGLYIGAGLGAGPRDGLTTALAARGHSIRVVRTGIELSVLALGWLLGGNVGIGTLVYAVAIGPLVHVTIPRFRPTVTKTS